MNQQSEILSRLAQLLEIPIAAFLVEAGDFLEGIEDLERQRLGLAASRGPRGLRLTLEPFPLAGSRAACAGPSDLAVYAYVWALRRIAAGCAIYAVDWGNKTASPIDLRRYRTAALVHCPSAP
jgi:hypothetical protein